MADVGKLWFDMDVRNNVIKQLNATTNVARTLQGEMKKVEGAMSDKIKTRMNQILEAKRKLDAQLEKAIKVGGVDTSGMVKARQELERLEGELKKLANGNGSPSMSRSLLGADTAIQIKNVNTALSETAKKIKEVEGQNQKTSFFSIKNWRSLASAIYSVRQITRTIGDIFNTVFGKTIEYEKSLSNLAAILQTNTDGVAGLEKQALQLGRTTNYTASQVLQLQTELSKLGYSEQEVRAATPGVLEFAQACGTDLASAAMTAGSAIRAFGADASETKDYVATMAIATTHSALQFSDFQTIIGTVFPVAHQFNLTVQDTTALMMKLKDAGMDTSTAATSLRNIFLNLSNGESKLSKLVGMDVHDMDTFVTAMKKMSDAAKTMGTEFLGISGNAAGKRGVTAFNVIAEQAKDLYRVRDTITDVNDELDEMASTQTRNAASAIKRVESAWEGWMLSIRESDGWLMNFLDGVAEGMNKIHDWFSSDSEITDAFSKEVANSTVKTQTYIQTLQDANASEEEKEKASKKLADQLVETGVCTQDLIDKMKDQYNYYDWLIEREGELTDALRVQAAERVSIREQENAQTEFNSALDTNSKKYAEDLAGLYEYNTGKEVTLTQQIELENEMKKSFARMSKAYQEYIKSGNRSDEDRQRFRKMQLEQFQQESIETFKRIAGAEEWKPDYSGRSYDIAMSNTSNAGYEAIVDYNSKLEQIKGNLDAIRDSWGQTDTIEAAQKRVNDLTKELENAKKTLTDANKSGNKSEAAWAKDYVAGLEAQLKDAQAILDQNKLEAKVKITNDTESLVKTLLDSEKKIDDFIKRCNQNKIDVPSDVKNFKETITKLKEVKAEADKAGTTVNIDVLANAVDAYSKLNGVSVTASSLNGRQITLNIGADASAFQRAIKWVKDTLAGLGVKVGVIDKTNDQETNTPNVTVPNAAKEDAARKAREKAERDAEKAKRAAEKAENERIARGNKLWRDRIDAYKKALELEKDQKKVAFEREELRIKGMSDGVSKDIAQKNLNDEKKQWDLELKRREIMVDAIQESVAKWVEGAKGDKKRASGDAPNAYLLDGGKLNPQAAKLVAEEVWNNFNEALANASKAADQEGANIIKKYWDNLDKTLRGTTPEFHKEVNEKEREQMLSVVKEEFANDDENLKKYTDLVNKYIDKKNKEVDLDELRKSMDFENLFSDLSTLTDVALKNLQKQLEDIIEKNKELDPQKMKEWVNALNKVKDAQRDLAPAQSIFTAAKKVRDTRNERDKMRNDVNALGEHKDDDIVVFRGEAMKYAEVLKRLTAVTKEYQNALNDAAKNAKKVFGQENWITDMLEGKGDKTFMEYFSGIMGGVAMNAQSASNLVDTLGWGDTNAGMDVKRIAGFIGGANNALQSFMKGDIFGALNDVFEGLASLDGLFGGGDSWAKEVESLRQSNEHLQQAIDSLADTISRAYFEDKSDNFKRMYEAQEKLNAQMLQNLKNQGGKGSGGFVGIGSYASANTNINEALSDGFWEHLLGISKGYWTDISNAVGKKITSAADLWTLTPEEWRLIREQATTAYDVIMKAVKDSHIDFSGDIDAYIEQANKLTDMLYDHIADMTSTTFDSLMQAFASGLDSMNDMTSSFGDNFTKILRTAIINAFTNSTAYRSALEALYKKMGEYADNEEYGAGGAIYSDREIADMRGDANALLEQQKEWQEVLQQMGLYQDQVSGMSGAIQGVTEETADLLASYINAIRADVSANREDIAMIANYVPEMHNTLAEGLLSLKVIESNTGRSADASEAIQQVLESVTTATGNGRALRVS